jgi:hypothetical protein
LEDGCHLLERHAEQVVQHEREALGRREHVEHDEERRADGFSQQRIVLGTWHRHRGRVRQRGSCR